MDIYSKLDTNKFHLSVTLQSVFQSLSIAKKLKATRKVPESTRIVKKILPHAIYMCVKGTLKNFCAKFQAIPLM